MRTWMIVLALVLGLAAAQSDVLSGEADNSLEYTLARFDSTGYVSRDDIRVARFRSVLDQLSSKYVENKQQIADFTANVRDMLREDGIEESVLNMMEGMNQLFTVEESNKIEDREYAEWIALYVALRRKGQSHADVISKLQIQIGTLLALGVR